MTSLDILSSYPSIDTKEVYNKIWDDIQQTGDFEDD